MADLVPHPLVTRVGLDLALKRVVTVPDAQTYNAVGALLAKLPQGVAAGAGVLPAPDGAIIDDDDKRAPEKNVVATTLANQENLPELVLVAGYLGGPVKRDREDWRLLYLDSRLQSWLLILENDIVVHQRLNDDHAPSGKRDALWINGTATMVHGSGSRANEGRFLVGDFTKAGDFAASATGGTFSAATGLLCEATTPGCCAGKRTR
jgi:hypothetical protein